MDAVEELLARQSIADVMHAYCRCADQNHNDEQAELFAEDGVADWGRGELRGRAAISAFLAEALSKYSATSHHVSNIEIDFADDDHASATSYVIAWHRHVEPGVEDFTLLGRYDDEWVRTAEGWRIARRGLRAAGGMGRDLPGNLPRRPSS
ncbi:MAG: nuclear transport factor 2 family protein [Actinomycetota bacterium]